MSNVYVVQRQMRFDHDKGVLVPRFPTIAQAEKWGPIIYALEPNAHPYDPEAAIGTLHSSLKDFCEDDYLVLVGNPILLGLATAICAHYNSGKVRFLQWSARTGDYVLIPSAIF